MVRLAGWDSHGKHVGTALRTGYLHGGGQHSSRRCTRGRRTGRRETWCRYDGQLLLVDPGAATQQSRRCSSMASARARSSYARETPAIQPCARRLASCPCQQQPRLGSQPMAVAPIAVARALLALFHLRCDGLATIVLSLPTHRRARLVQPYSTEHEHIREAYQLQCHNKEDGLRQLDMRAIGHLQPFCNRLEGHNRPTRWTCSAWPAVQLGL